MIIKQKHLTKHIKYIIYLFIKKQGIINHMFFIIYFSKIYLLIIYFNININSILKRKEKKNWILLIN